MRLTRKDKEVIFELLDWRLEGIKSYEFEEYPELKQILDTFLKIRMDLKGY